MALKYLEDVLSKARRYLDDYSDCQPRVDGYLVSLLITVASHRRFPVNTKDEKVFSKGVEGLVGEFSSWERLEVLS